MKHYELIEQYKELHSSDEQYGTSAFMYIQEICLFIRQLKPKSVLDYGCGKGHLVDVLKLIFRDNITFYKYDPSIEEFSSLPVQKADLIINTDVLEHIPYDKIDSVLQEMSEISQNVVFGLAHYPAATILPNGQNAHCIVEMPKWYKEKLKKYFPKVRILKWKQRDCTMAVTFELNKKTRERYAEIVGCKMGLYEYLKDVALPKFKSFLYRKNEQKSKKYKTLFEQNYYDLM